MEQQQEQERDTCVYLHHKQSDGVCFYVGIGNAQRPYDAKRRSTIWKRTAAKHGRTVTVIAENLTWDAACFLEVSAIALLGRRNLKQGALVNLTNGGEGAKGLLVSEETRNKVSAKNRRYMATLSAQGLHQMQDSEVRAKLSASLRAIYADPIRGSTLRAKMSDSRQALYADPVRGTACRAKISASVSATLQALHANPERGPSVRARIRAGLQTLLADPVRGDAWRAKLSAARTPEFRAKSSSSKKELYADPVRGAAVRGKISAANTLPANLLKLNQTTANKLPKAGTKRAKAWALLEHVIKETGKMPFLREFARMAEEQGFGKAGVPIHGHYRAHQLWLTNPELFTDEQLSPEGRAARKASLVAAPVQPAVPDWLRNSPNWSGYQAANNPQALDAA